MFAMNTQLEFTSSYQATKHYVGDPSARKHGGNECSREAFRRVDAKSDCAAILAKLKAFPSGLTLDQLCELLGRTPNQISGRITDLRRAGRIETTSERRETRSGAMAFVHKIL